MTTFEQDLLDAMGCLIEAIDRQTEAFRVATDSQLLTAKKLHAQTERQFRFYSGMAATVAAQKPDEEEAHSEHPMD